MDRTIIEDRAGRGESRDSFSLSCNGTSAGIAGAVDRQNCGASPSEGHARVNPIPCEAGVSASWVYLVQDRCKASSSVASCLIKPDLAVADYPTDCLIRCPSFVPP